MVPVDGNTRIIYFLKPDCRMFAKFSCEYLLHYSSELHQYIPFWIL